MLVVGGGRSVGVDVGCGRWFILVVVVMVLLLAGGLVVRRR